LIVSPGRLAAGRLNIDGDDHAYLFRVRRLAVGDAVVVFDGAGREAPAVAIEIGPTHAVLEVAAPRDVLRPAPHITVVQAVLKGERMDWCLEKLVEVGADAIVVVETARAIVRLDDDRRAKRIARHQRIAQEAARQCGRADIPSVIAVADLAAALASLTAETRLVADPASDTPLLTLSVADTGLDQSIGSANTVSPTVALVVGPEGGLTADEVAAAVAAGCAPVSLGATILRAETAGAAAVFAIRAARAAGFQ
jgi:16S rRNA (uracil1498-N3)-methyltransferase